MKLDEIMDEKSIEKARELFPVEMFVKGDSTRKLSEEQISFLKLYCDKWVNSLCDNREGNQVTTDELKDDIKWLFGKINLPNISPLIFRAQSKAVEQVMINIVIRMFEELSNYRKDSDFKKLIK